MMIQVLNRAFDIVEYIAADRSQPHTITAIAGALHLNQATCANIIKTLVIRGYLEQVSKKEGYQLGAMAYHLTDNYSLKQVLVEAAAEPMEQLAQDLNEGTILAILKGNKRLILLDEKSTHELQVINKTEKEAYATSTGRLLLAFIPENKLEQYIKKYGLPEQPTWPEVQNEKDLLIELAQIRKHRLAQQTAKSSIMGLAVPIMKDDQVIASMGIYLPLDRFVREKKNEIVQELDKTAHRINNRLEHF